MLRTLRGIFVIAALAYASMVGFTVGAGFMNTSSDVGVFVGFLLAVCSPIAAGFLAFKYLKREAEIDIRRLVNVAMIGLVASSGAACTRVGPGYAGIKVSMAGDERGVADLAATTGWVFYNPMTSNVYEYPTFMQTYAWEKEEAITFQSREGLPIIAAINLSYQLDFAKVPSFYVKFRNDNLENFTDGYLHNVARDAFNAVGANYTVEDIYGAKKEELLGKVKERINADVSGVGVTLQQFGLVGAVQLPPSVQQALDSKIKATQDALRVENELRQAEAEARKAVAWSEGQAKSKIALAEGESRANRALAESLSPSLLEWRRLQIQQEATQKWNGALPTITTGGGVPLINIPIQK